MLLLVPCNKNEEVEKAYIDGYMKRDSEIVRCEDCKWRGKLGCSMRGASDKAFCSYGERKDKE